MAPRTCRYPSVITSIGSPGFSAPRSSPECPRAAASSAISVMSTAMKSFSTLMTLPWMTAFPVDWRLAANSVRNLLPPGAPAAEIQSVSPGRSLGRVCCCPFRALWLNFRIVYYTP